MVVHMPVLEGLRATRTICENGRSTPIYAMTASVMKGDIEEYLSAGMAGCVDKPTDRMTLEHVLSEIQL